MEYQWNMNILMDLNPNFLSFLFTGDRIANGISRNQGNKRSVKQIHPRIGTAKRWPWESKKVNFWTIIIKAHLFQRNHTNNVNHSLSNSKCLWFIHVWKDYCSKINPIASQPYSCLAGKGYFLSKTLDCAVQSLR